MIAPRGGGRVQALEHQRRAEGARRGLNPRLQACLQFSDDAGGRRGALAGAEPGLAWSPSRCATPDRLADAAPIWIGPAPTLSNQPPPQELEQMLHIARQFDVAARDERNPALGRTGDTRRADAGEHADAVPQRQRWDALQDVRGRPAGSMRHRTRVLTWVWGFASVNWTARFPSRPVRVLLTPYLGTKTGSTRWWLPDSGRAATTTGA